PACAVIDGYGPGRADAAIGAGRGGDRVGVDRETRGDRVVRDHVREQVRADGAYGAPVHENIGDVVPGVRRDGEELAPAVADGHCARWTDAAVRSRGRRDRKAWRSRLITVE